MGFAWRRATASEEDEQIAFVEWMEHRKILFCHVPNGGNRNPITGRKLKAAGVKAGVPDILIFDRPTVNAKQYIGLAIEMKRQGGRLRSNQMQWLSRLRERGWYTAVCYGAEEAIELCQESGF